MYQRLAILAATILVTGAFATAPSHALSIDPCAKADRNAVFSVPAKQVAAFQAFVSRYARERGYGYYGSPPGERLIVQQLNGPGGSASILVFSERDGGSTTARLQVDTACEKALSPDHARLWKAFLESAARAGYPPRPAAKR